MNFCFHMSAVLSNPFYLFSLQNSDIEIKEKNRFVFFTFLLFLPDISQNNVLSQIRNIHIWTTYRNCMQPSQKKKYNNNKKIKTTFDYFRVLCFVQNILALVPAKHPPCVLKRFIPKAHNIWTALMGCSEIIIFKPASLL